MDFIQRNSHKFEKHRLNTEDYLNYEKLIKNIEVKYKIEFSEQLRKLYLFLESNTLKSEYHNAFSKLIDAPRCLSS